MTLGFVVGKFYPPHRGHKHLIDTARSQVDRLVVLLAHHPSQRIPGELVATGCGRSIPIARSTSSPTNTVTIHTRGPPSPLLISAEHRMLCLPAKTTVSHLRG